MDPKHSDKAIITPVKTSRTPQLGPVAALLGTKADFEVVRRRLLPRETHPRNLFTGYLYTAAQKFGQFVVAGPLMGAPAAAMFLETLIAWGVRRLVYFGWCGAIAPQVHIGDIIIPNGAVIDEGTSRHYHAELNQTVAPSPNITDTLKQVLHTQAQPFHDGLIWTTDALFRETPAKVTAFQKQGVLGVEMETSALFTVADYQKIEIGCILVVSDELATLQWQPGFKDERFKKTRAVVSNLIPEVCNAL